MQFSDIPYAVGDRVSLHSRGDYGHIRAGETGIVTNIGDGIFEGDFYTSFITDDGRKATGFSWRFKTIEERGPDDLPIQPRAGQL